MGCPKARFSISIEDQLDGTMLKVELIEPLGSRRERRLRVRVNGKQARTVPDRTLLEVVERLRHWTVKRPQDSDGQSMVSPRGLQNGPYEVRQY